MIPVFLGHELVEGIRGGYERSLRDGSTLRIRREGPRLWHASVDGPAQMATTAVTDFLAAMELQRLVLKDFPAWSIAVATPAFQEIGREQPSKSST